MRNSIFLALGLFATPCLADIDEIVDQFINSDVIVLGEVHGNAEHHLVQANITAAIQPSALVFQMFTPEQAAIINSRRWEGSDILSLAEEFDWQKSGWPDFEYYAKIINADPEGVVFGAAVPQADIEAAIFEGAAAVFGLEAEIYGLDRILPPEELLARSIYEYQINCENLGDKHIQGLIEAQRLRSAVLADTVFRALDEVGEPVIVIAGNDYGRADWGLPSVLEVSDSELVVVTLGQVENEPTGKLPFTEYLVSNVVDNVDHCLDFRG